MKPTNDDLRALAESDQCQATFRELMWLKQAIAVYESGDCGGYDTYEEYMDATGQSETLRVALLNLKQLAEDSDGR